MRPCFKTTTIMFTFGAGKQKQGLETGRPRGLSHLKTSCFPCVSSPTGLSPRHAGPQVHPAKVGLHCPSAGRAKLPFWFLRLQVRGSGSQAQSLPSSVRRVNVSFDNLKKKKSRQLRAYPPFKVLPGAALMAVMAMLLGPPPLTINQDAVTSLYAHSLHPPVQPIPAFGG